jgi:hypothetical protein
MTIEDAKDVKPLFQQRAAIISLRSAAYALGHLAEGNQEAAASWNKVATAYAALATVKVSSPVMQALLNSIDLERA